MSITISADDLRSIKALEIAATADQWLAFRTADGEWAYRVPSQCDPARSYVVTASRCDCPDFQRNTLAAAHAAAFAGAPPEPDADPLASARGAPVLPDEADGGGAGAPTGDPVVDSVGLRACKHMLAVRLYAELVRAQRNLARAPSQRRRAS